MSYKINKQFWLRWLERYKSHRCLWDHTASEYKNRRKRSHAYKDLLQMMKKIDPDADEAGIKRQINNYRSVYRRNLLLVEEAKSKGEIYKPHLFYYDLLDSFLNPEKDGEEELDDSRDNSGDEEQEELENCDIPLKMESCQYLEDSDTFSSMNQTLNEVSQSKSRKQLENEERNEFWMQWLQKYKSYRCLWDTKSEEYRNWKKKKIAYDDLLKMMQTIKPDADESAMKRQINNFRTTYRRHYMLVEKSKSKRKKFKPQLFYYDLIDSFLNPKKNGDIDCGELEDASCNYESEGDQQDNEEKKSNSSINMETMESDFKNEDCNKSDSYDEASSSFENNDLIEMKPYTNEISKNPYPTKRQIEDFWIQWLEKYKSLPCLWDRNSPDFRNKELKIVAYYELLEMMRIIKPDADEAAVKKQIHNYRSGYRRCRIQVEKSKLRGEVLKPQLYYYDLLHSISNPKNDTNQDCGDMDEFSGSNLDGDDRLSDQGDNTFSHMGYTEETETTSIYQEAPQLSRKRRREEDIDTKKECRIMARRLITHFKKMNETQRLIAERLVAEICTLGRMEKLQLESFISLPNTASDELL